MIDATGPYLDAMAQEPQYPKFKVYSYVLNDTDGWAEIIEETHAQTPTDLTQHVARLDMTFDRVQVTMADDSTLLFHPDGGVLRHTVKQGRVIRVKEGFEGLPESEWLWTFTGTVEGNPSWTYERDRTIDIRFTVFSRQNNQAWKRRNVTSENFTIGSDWGQMFHNITNDIMLMDEAETIVPNPWAIVFDKNTNQIVNTPPWEALEGLAFGAMALPWFNGRGQLKLIPTTQDRVTYTLTDDKYLIRYEAPSSGGEWVNKVILVYLSNSLSRVDGEDQVLGSAMVTTGFFRPKQDITVYYSDERKTRSDNPRFIVLQSVNSGLLPVGSESMVKLDEFSSKITVSISVWTAVLATALLATYLLMAFIPDWGHPVGFGAIIVDVPLGKIIQAIALIGILVIMMSIGTGQYEVWGTPYEMVYLEKQAIAQVAGLEFWEERERQIRNDFISTEEIALPLAQNQLHYEVMKGQPRNLLMRYDPRFEPGDILQLSSTVKVYVGDVKRTLVYGSTEPNKITISGWKTVL